MHSTSYVSLPSWTGRHAHNAHSLTPVDLSLQSAVVPVPFPGSQRLLYPLAPEVTQADELAVANVVKVADFLLGGQAARLAGTPDPREGVKLLQEMAPFLPALAYEILPEVRSPCRVSLYIPCVFRSLEGSTTQRLYGVLLHADGLLIELRPDHCLARQFSKDFLLAACSQTKLTSLQTCQFTTR